MSKTLIAMSSITYAMKAKELLNAQGFYCEIERTPKNLGSGCGYSLRIRDHTEEIIRLLEQHGIPIKAVLKAQEGKK